MDRLIKSAKRKRRLFKEFECMDVVPYSIAILLLLAEGYILCEFLHLYGSLKY